MFRFANKIEFPLFQKPLALISRSFPAGFLPLQSLKLIIVARDVFCYSNFSELEAECRFHQIKKARLQPGFFNWESDERESKGKPRRPEDGESP